MNTKEQHLKQQEELRKLEEEHKKTSKKMLEKYDSESKTRTFTGPKKQLLRFMLIAFSIYCIMMNFTFHFETRINRASFVGLLVFFAYLIYPINRKQDKTKIPIYDLILAGLSAFCYFYFVFNCKSIINLGVAIEPFHIAIGIVGILLTLEACRRVTGLPIVIVSSMFILYGLTQKSLKINIYNLFYTTDGIIGTPIRACQNYIVLFVIFGAFLEKTGISEFFIELANSIAGASSGGPAKVSVIASALCGMVSGSSVGNTVTTGSVTIPLMKKNGYKGDFAGAVEAAASTGGQIMPPIMGAAAFLMVEYTGEQYSFIALRAILPALLYFAGIFISVHLEAKKLGLKGISKDTLPVFSAVMKRSWYLLLPLITLTYMIVQSTMAKAALIAILVAIVVSKPSFKSQILVTLLSRLLLFDDIILLAQNFITTIDVHTLSIIVNCLFIVVLIAILLINYLHTKHNKKKNNKDNLMTLDKVGNALEQGARSTLSVGIACAVAGIIACIITTTGVGTLLISSIVSIANGNIVIAMILTMITCIILGMGVPTTANYVIMATTCAPILTNMGMNYFAANMFVFYFGIVADITPPVALAAYAGAAIAGSKPIPTAFNATQLAIAAFIVPFIFGLNPSLLFIDTNAVEVITIIITSLLGIFGVASGLRGYALRETEPIQRLMMIIGGLLLIYPGTFTDVVGTLLVLSSIAIDIYFLKKVKVKG